jgi:hypothetical protein
MAKLHIFYNLNDYKLKIKIDDKPEFEVDKYEEKEIELENGKHNVEMYVQTIRQSFGLISENIEMNNEDLFYYYKVPLTFYQKGKLIKVNSSEDFLKQKKIYKIKLIILFTFIAILIIFAKLF